MAKYLNEKVTNVKWIHDSLEIMEADGFPLTNSIMRELGMGQRVTGYHFTSQTKVPQLAALQGTRKTISAMTRIPKTLLHLPLGGVWEGGVLYQVSGDLALISIDDVNSKPDQRGRRWILLSQLHTGSPQQAKLKEKVVEKFTQAVDADPSFRQAYNQAYQKASTLGVSLDTKLAAVAISKYFDLALKFAKQNKEDLRKLLSLGKPSFKAKTVDYMFGWNELLLNNIKLEKVIFIDALNYSPAINKDWSAPKNIRPLPQSLRNKIISSVPVGNAVPLRSNADGEIPSDALDKAIKFIMK